MGEACLATLLLAGLARELLPVDKRGELLPMDTRGELLPVDRRVRLLPADRRVVIALPLPVERRVVGVVLLPVDRRVVRGLSRFMTSTGLGFGLWLLTEQVVEEAAVEAFEVEEVFEVLSLVLCGQGKAN